jgi:tetratricopeptide (TPR) repeat protein
VGVEGLWKLAQHAHLFVVRHGYWQHWYTCLYELQEITSPPPQDYLWLQLELSQALRWLGKFGEALALLDEIPHRADLIDNPLRMSRLLIERAATLLYLNDTEEVLRLAYEAYERIGNRSPELRDRSIAIIAQALYELSPEQSRDWLRRLSRPDVAALSLEARVALRLGEARLALQQASESVARSSPDEPAYARTIGLLAQSMVANGEVDAAIQHFQLAINHLQQRQDLVGMARLHNNLGVVFHIKQDIKRATEQFKKSLEIHRRLQDFSGQQTAQENLSYVLSKQSTSGGFPHFLTDRPDFHDSND